MLFFPQLATGAAMQFPCTKKIHQRTIVNEAADGATIKLFDPGACTVEWEFSLSGLTEAEWDAIASLFETAGGRLGSFGFLDPFGNLLRWSEEPSAAVWSKHAGISISSGLLDPFGSNQASRLQNLGPTEQGISQTVTAPACFQYCLSVYVRSDTASSVTLTATAGAQLMSQAFGTRSGWQRLQFPTMPGGQTTAVTFGLRFAAGATVDVFGFQAEAQVGASSYKRTTTHSAVFPNASFLQDELKLTSNAPGEFSCALRIGANAS